MISRHISTLTFLQTESAAKREIHFLMLDDLAYADEAMREAGIRVEPTEYEIHEVSIK